MKIRLRIKDVAREKRIGMGQLSRRSDVSYQTIKRIWDDPYYSVTTATLAKLAYGLGVEPGELLVLEPEEGDTNQ